MNITLEEIKAQIEASEAKIKDLKAQIEDLKVLGFEILVKSSTVSVS